MTNPLFLQLVGDDQLVLVVSNPDGFPTGAFGPFPDDVALAAAKEALLQVGVEMHRCETLPLRNVVSQP